MATPFFQNIWTGYTTSLIAGSQQAANTLLVAAAPEMVVAMSTLVFVCGVRMMMGKMSAPDFLLNAVRALTISALYTAAMYSQFVEQFVLTTVPDFIASAMGHGAAGVTAATQFDLIRSAINHETAALLHGTDNSLNPVMAIKSGEITSAGELATVMLSCCFGVDLVNQALVAIVAPVGTVVLGFYLFQATRRWAEGWIGKLFALLLLQVMIAILLIVITQQFRNNQLTLSAQNGSGIDLDEAISNLFAIGWEFAIGLFVLIALPGMAAAIGGSHVSNIVVMPLQMGVNAANQMAEKIAGAIKSSMNKNQP